MSQCTKEKPACDPCLQLGLQCNYSRKISRTPLTRNNLTIAEDRVRDLEAAFKTIFPGVDVDTVLASIQSGNSEDSASRAATKESSKSPLANVQDVHDADSPSESLPREADGFDWSENAVTLTEISDGMAALSINPEGAGYLGKSYKILHSMAYTKRGLGRCYFKCRPTSCIA